MKEKNKLTSDEAKMQEELEAYKRDKHFLDLLAISDGKKEVQVKSTT